MVWSTGYDDNKFVFQPFLETFYEIQNHSRAARHGGTRIISKSYRNGSLLATTFYRAGVYSQVYLVNMSRTLSTYEYLVPAYITLLLVISTRSIVCHALLCFECFDVVPYSRTEPSISDDACLAKAHERSLVQIRKDRSLGSDACVLVQYLFV